MSADKKKPPVVKLRAGLLQVAIWRNESEKGPWFSVTLLRSYQNEAGEWQETDSLNGYDLLEAAELLRLAWHRVNKLREVAKAEAQVSGEAE